MDGLGYQPGSEVDASNRSHSVVEAVGWDGDGGRGRSRCGPDVSMTTRGWELCERGITLRSRLGWTSGKKGDQRVDRLAAQRDKLTRVGCGLGGCDESNQNIVAITTTSEITH